MPQGDKQECQETGTQGQQEPQSGERGKKLRKEKGWRGGEWCRLNHGEGLSPGLESLAQRVADSTLMGASLPRLPMSVFHRVQMPG